MKKTNEASKVTGVSKRTLQYYDNEGILLVQRTPQNHRIYDHDSLETVWKILVYKEMKFELQDIKRLLKYTDKEIEPHFKQRKIEIQNSIDELRVQMKFVELVEQQGIPPTPQEDSGLTYKDAIDELRRKIKTII